MSVRITLLWGQLQTSLAFQNGMPVRKASLCAWCVCQNRMPLWPCIYQTSLALEMCLSDQSCLSDMSIRWVLFCHWNVCQASLGLELSRDLMVKLCQTTQGHIRIWNWHACQTSIVVSLACLSDQHCFVTDLYVTTVLLYHVRSVTLILFCNWHACLD